MSDHRPVLLAEALEGLALDDAGWYIDGTYGRGGHSTAILARIGERGRLLALDKDPEAVADGQRRFADDPRFTIAHAGFEEIRAVAEPWLDGRKSAGILLDLGVSSPQIESEQRGFSFSRDGPLDMRMNITRGPTAAQWLAEVDEGELVTVLRRFGEEPRARRIAAAILRARDQSALRTTGQLADVVAAAAPAGRSRIHPATRTFQAIRIAINKELEALESALFQSLELLGVAARLAVISFHSLEDRIVKRFIARESRGDPAYAGLPDIPPAARARLRPVGKLIRPSEQELAENPRARSARLRVAERLAVGSPA
jgi:16S rRNA (cytosine1402-N4)-methyltransferase